MKYVHCTVIQSIVQCTVIKSNKNVYVFGASPGSLAVSAPAGSGPEVWGLWGDHDIQWQHSRQERFYQWHKCFW